MLSQPLQDGLHAYAIGPKLRALRLKKQMGLVDLGKRCGLSAALLSKIERGLLFPTLPTLLRVALVFDVGLEFFFARDRDNPLAAVVRSGDRPRPGAQSENGGAPHRFEPLDFRRTEHRFRCYRAEFFAGTPDTLHPHTHEGVEFIYVIEGTLGVRLHDADHTLAAGDSMCFDSSAPHSYRRCGGRRCRAVVVTDGGPA